MSRQLLDHQQRLDWLCLSQSENVGPVTFRQLIRRYGSAAVALENLADMSRRGGLKRPLKLFTKDMAEKTLEQAHKLGAQFVVAGEEGYPPLLFHLADAPPLLCVKGNLSLAAMTTVAIVGARNASAGGLRLARTLAAELSEAGVLVVSGLARGIDTAAHQACPAARTAAVIAGGIDNFYPPENAALQQAIAENGLLISELLPGMAPKAEHFPRRNRIISGMSRAVVVVEAALRSGSLITARLAAEQNRDVFAVPGSPLDPRAEGTNRLIKTGAILLTSTQDILDSLQQPQTLFEVSESDFLDVPPIALEAMPDDRERVLTLLSYTPTDLDDVIRESHLPAALVYAILLEAELAGKLTRMPNQKICLI